MEKITAIELIQITKFDLKDLINKYNLKRIQ